MAGNKINIDLSVQDQSSTIKQRTNDAKQLNNELEKAQRLMTGTKSGSKAMRASYGGVAGGDVEEYNRARGAAEAGGASARDFADQARGLGGLVRLYATYAANIFAVSAAFTALREAMQTDIMIKGLQQLSAASGTSMGSLAKQFSDVTDGAISFRESMQATAKAVSSGLSSSQFIELGKVAKGASQALGLDMSDAVSRLTRGITKLEPELLDELGLFTKTGKAAEEYARKVGKTEAQLTDFERRQAFANAVLEEGRQKFGQIAQAGNPYDKLLAQLKDVAQNILSTVNSIITPIAKLLADNTGLIGAAIALAAVKITKQALPALTSWQAGLKDAAKVAKDRMGDVNEAFQGVFYSKAAAAAGIPELEKQLKAAQQSLTKSVTDKRTLESSSFKQVTTAKELSDKDRLKLAKDIDKYETSTVKHRQDQVAAAKELLRIDSEIKNIRNQLNSAHDKTIDQMGKEAKFGSALWQREQMTRAARQRYAELDIRSRVSENVDTMGVRGAIQELYKETTANKDISRLGKFKTVALGTFAAVTRGVEIAASAFSRFFFVIGAAVAVFEVLYSWLNKNSEQIQILEKNTSILEETIKTATDTAEKYKGAISSDAIIAFSNSLDGLTESLNSVIKSFVQAQDAAGYWDRLWDKIKDITPFVDSLQESTSKSISKGLVAAIENVPEGPMRDELSKKFLQTLNLGDTTLINSETFLPALKGLDTENYIKTLKQLGVDQSSVNDKFKESTIYLKGLKSSGEAATKAMQAFSNSLKDTSPIAQFFGTSIKYADELSKGLRSVDFNAQLGALDELTKTDLTIFDPSVGLRIAEQSQQTKKLIQDYNEYNKVLQTNKDRIKSLQDQRKILKMMGPLAQDFFGMVEFGDLDEKLKNAQSLVKASETGAENIRDRLREIAVETQRLIADSVEATIDRSLSIFIKKLRQSVLEQQKFMASKFPVTTEAGIDLSLRLNKEQIKLDADLISSQERLAASQDLLRIQIQRLADMEELKSLPTQGRFPSERQAKLRSRIEAADTAESLFQENNLNTLKTAARSNASIYPLVERLMRSKLASQQADLKIVNEQLNADLAKIGLQADKNIAVLAYTIKGFEDSISNIVTDSEKGINTKSEMLLKLSEMQRSKVLAENEKQIQLAEKVSETIQKIAPGDKKLVSDAAAIVQQTKDQAAFNLLIFDQNELGRRVNQTTDDYIKILDIKYEKLSKELALQQELRNLENIRLENSLRLQEELLGQAERFRILTDDQIRNQRKRIQEQRIESELTNKLKDLDKSRAEALRDYQKSTANQDDMTFDVEASDKYVKNIETLKVLEKQYIATAEGQRQLLEAQNQFTLREEAYADAFVRSFDRMTDAVVEFTKTGKLNFKNLINSFLEDLLRFEVKTAMQQTLSSLGGGMGLAKTVLGRVGLASGKQTPETMLQPKGTEGDPLYVTIVGPSISSYTGLGREPGKPAPIFDRSSPDFYTGRQFEADLPASNTSELLAANRIPYIVSGAEGPFLQPKGAMQGTAEDGRVTVQSSSKLFESGLKFGERWEAEVTPSIERVSENLKRSFTIDSQALTTSMITGFEGGFQGLASIVQRTALQAGGSLLGGLFKSFAGGGFGTGNLFGNLDFGGFFADGGNIPKGSYGVVGEVGPEIVTGPATVYPMHNTSQGKVEVVVNNYSNASAQTRETTDSRGNRRIEVIVGEMVAGEMSRSNSAVQQSLTNNFGARPMVARR